MNVIKDLATKIFAQYHGKYDNITIMQIFCNTVINENMICEKWAVRKPDENHPIMNTLFSTEEEASSCAAVQILNYIPVKVYVLKAL